MKIALVRFAAMMSTVVAVALAPAGAAAQSPQGRAFVLGAGSTFAAPLYDTWIRSFTKDRPGISINYDAVGSGEGISRFITGSVDFAGTDAPLTATEAAGAKGGVLQVPSTAGMIVLAYQLSGFKGDLRLPRDVYPEILAGNVRHWDDPRIQAANPGAVLPHRNIALAARLDSSGTTFALTRHLAAVNGTWRQKGPGVGKLVSWRGAMLARGNEGVAHKIKISDGIIGYVEYGFAARLKLPMAALENAAGAYVLPTAESGRAAIESVGQTMPDDLATLLDDPKGRDAYPIVTLSWLLLRDRYPDPVKAATIKDFVSYGLTDGQAVAASLGYVPLPATVSQRSREQLAGIQ